MSATRFSRRDCGETSTVINPAATAASICRLTVPYADVTARSDEKRSAMLRETEERFAAL